MACVRSMHSGQAWHSRRSRLAGRWIEVKVATGPGGPLLSSRLRVSPRRGSWSWNGSGMQNIEHSAASGPQVKGQEANVQGWANACPCHYGLARAALPVASVSALCCRWLSVRRSRSGPARFVHGHRRRSSGSSSNPPSTRSGPASFPLASQVLCCTSTLNAGASEFRGEKRGSTRRRLSDSGIGRGGRECRA